MLVNVGTAKHSPMWRQTDAVQGRGGPKLQAKDKWGLYCGDIAFDTICFCGPAETIFTSNFKLLSFVQDAVVKTVVSDTNAGVLEPLQCTKLPSWWSKG